MAKAKKKTTTASKVVKTLKRVKNIKAAKLKAVKEPAIKFAVVTLDVQTMNRIRLIVREEILAYHSKGASNTGEAAVGLQDAPKTPEPAFKLKTEDPLA